MKFLSQYKDLPKRVYIICGARIITAMGMFIFSFTSLILTSILGFSEVTSGYVLMVSSICGIVGAFVFGRLADILGRKKVLITALSIGTVNLFIGGLICRTPYVIGVILIANLIFSGVLPIIAAMVTDWSEEENRTQCFSLLWLCINLGFSVGQVFAGMLFYNYYPWIFWGQGLGWLLTVVIIGRFIEDDFVPVVEKRTSSKLDKASFIPLVLKDKVLLGFILALILLIFCHTQLSFMIPLQYKTVLGLQECSLLVSHMWLINGICCVLFTPLLSLLISKLGSIKSIFIAAAIFVLSFLIYSLQGTATICLIVTPLWTCGEIICNTTGGVFIASRSPEAFRARYQSLNSFAVSFGQCTAPIIMSYFLIQNTYLSGWRLSAAVSLAATFIIALIIKKDKNDASRD